MKFESNKYSKGIPQQKNGYDCGVFVCMFAEYLSRNESFDFDQKHMDYFRRKITYEIVHNKLLIP
jgi:sentrin-specific protease 1